jgi:hypothetical protein
LASESRIVRGLSARSRHDAGSPWQRCREGTAEVTYFSYEETFGWQPAHLPAASAVWERLVSLPIFPTMSEAEIGHVTATVRDLCARFARVDASARQGN